MPRQYIRLPLEERFWSKVDKTSSPNGCWLWTGCTRANSSAYGVIEAMSTDGKWRPAMAHRVSWEIHNGAIPDGLMVLHNCPGGDNKGCVNPSHLWLGTTTDNMRDASSKRQLAFGDRNWTRRTPERLPHGDDHWTRRFPERVLRGENHQRHLHPETVPRGEKHASSKLTWAIVAEIRRRYAAGETQTAMGRIFGVTQATISCVVLNKTWVIRES